MAPLMLVGNYEVEIRLNNYAYDMYRDSWGWRCHTNLRRDAWPNMPPLDRDHAAGFTLQRVTKPSHPPIDVVLAFGPIFTTYSVSQRFARDMKFYHLDVEQHLLWLNNMKNGDEKKTEILCGVLPNHLEEALRSGTGLHRELLMPMLLKMIDVLVEEGWRSFIVSGIVEDGPTVVMFMEEIAEPSAVLFFHGLEARTSAFYQLSVGLFGGTDRAVEVAVKGEDVEEAYWGLLGEIGKRVFEGSRARAIVARNESGEGGVSVEVLDTDGEHSDCEDEEMLDFEDALESPTWYRSDDETGVVSVSAFEDEGRNLRYYAT